MEVRTERPRTAGRIAPTGRVTPTVHQTGGGRRKAIPVPPPRVPTPMPVANNNQQRNIQSALSARDIPGVKIESAWYLNLAAGHKCGVDRMFCQALPRANPGRNERRTNNANVVVPPTVSAVSKKEPQENIARIAKRYLDDNMQQAWINPRLISMVSEYKCNDYAPDPRTCAPIRAHYTSWFARELV
ncbi:hypothetical protein ALC57_06982 [Trachymyrmex cornetzi]|uniref:Uncharacterized protein n=1 Tax=Trachymyrmex cornetzi TaxID=471704 RepID=A0A195E642_9HYME|nr:hypothetical protein ALC57_06982 [Trachymyrmex cornetzi]